MAAPSASRCLDREFRRPLGWRQGTRESILSRMMEVSAKRQKPPQEQPRVALKSSASGTLVSELGLIEAFLRRSGRHRRFLEALQQEIDQRRATAASPEEAVAAISGMMCNSFYALIDELGGLRSELTKLREATKPLSEAQTTEVLAASTDQTTAQENCASLSR